MLSAAVNDRLAVDVADAQALKYKAASGDPAALRAAARQFEAMMVAQMLKGMRQTQFNSAEDDPFGSQTMKLYQDMLDQQWASRISQGKGLGYADMLTKAMQTQTTPAPNATPLQAPVGRPLPSADGSGLPLNPVVTPKSSPTASPVAASCAARCC